MATDENQKFLNQYRGSVNTSRLLKCGAPFQIADPLADPDWDRHMLESGRGSIFHTSGWARVLQETYGYTPCYVTGNVNNRLTALVPLMEIKSFVTGKRAVSLPFTDYCDVILDDPGNTGPELLAFLNRCGQGRKWRSWEIRGGDALFGQAAAPSSCYDRHVLKLSKDIGSLYQNTRSSTKRNIKKAEREGVTILRADTINAVRGFYRLHCLTRKKHGLPPQSWGFFQKMQEHLIGRGQGQVLLGQYQGKTIAAAIFLHHGREAIYKFGASDSSSLQVRPNDLIMWSAIEQYGREGYEHFCFGRTDQDNAGLLQFKAGWGAEESRINYYKYDLKENTYTRNIVKATGSHNKIFRSMPLPLLKLAGAVLYRHMG